MMEVLIEVAAVYVRCSYRHHQLMRVTVIIIIIIKIITISIVTLIILLPISLIALHHNHQSLVLPRHHHSHRQPFDLPSHEMMIIVNDR